MLYHAYRFSCRAAFDAVRDDAPPGAELDEIGAVASPVLVAEDGGISGGDALPGWHINAIWGDAEPPSWTAARIPLDDAPRWWAGVPRVLLPLPPSLGDYERAIQAHIDATAGQRGYSSGVSCASYAASTVPKFASEAAAFTAWRDAVWIAVHDRLAEVQGGAPAPTVAGLIADLPAMVWPA